MTLEQRESSPENQNGVIMWVQPFILSLLAGLSTSLGAACVFCLKSKGGPKDQPALSHAHMAFALSLAGSVMVTVSFASILPESFQDETADDSEGYQMIPFQSFLMIHRSLSFGLGCLLYALLSKCAFPEPDAILLLDEDEVESLTLNRGDVEERAAIHPPNLRRVASSSNSVGDDKARSSSSSKLEPRDLVKRQISSSPRRLCQVTAAEQGDGEDSSLNNNDKTDRRFMSWTTGSDLQTNSARRAWRVTMLLFVSLAVHNFPEGLAVAASTMHSVHLGLTTTIAIALHNIPEGIAIAIPCLAARPDSPCLAFVLASVSGLFEPLGALVALFLLRISTSTDANDMSLLSMDNVLAFVAGIMTTVALIELFPEALRHSTDSSVPFALGFVAGVAVMLGSEMYLDS
ncbi:hypothetical protein ACA910_017115 [Epithemia clementina (nom. ined.)]